jgi:sugar O-acyltransferase (sialic acid O-acetyltransferase NeuD family)
MEFTVKMSDAHQIQIPLLNPNEPEAWLVSLHVVAKQRVDQGEVLCTLETTKSTAEVIAEVAGYVVGLRFAEGDRVTAGETLCWLAPEPSWQVPVAETMEQVGDSKRIPDGVRITEPALALAQEAALNLSELPIGPLITQEIIRKAMAMAGKTPYQLPAGPFGPQAMILYGGGGHGKSLIDLIRVLANYELLGVIDDAIAVENEVMGLPVLGGGEVLLPLFEKGVHLAVNAVGGVGDMRSRVLVFERILEVGYTCPTLIHPGATVESSAELAAGGQVFPRAYIGSEARIGFGVIVNTAAVVSHDCQVEDYANIAPGALLAGGVSVGEGVLIGMGVTINLNVTIGAGARIGNSAVVKDDVPPEGIVRAGAVWPPR